jgi:mediator of RNA polymerase II transcription subunit 14
MPGILLKMNHNGPQGGEGTRDATDRSRALVNGDRSVSNLNQPAASSGGVQLTSATQMDQLPPEIQHLAAQYHPLSTLLSRTSQECFNMLSEKLTAMADMPVAPQPSGPLTNGVGVHATTNGAGNTSKNNVEKKRLLMKFAEDQRAKFIKLLVISQWARRAPEIVKIIDLKAWADMQIAELDAVVSDIGVMRLAMGNARQPNPDIKTALEILSTGKASWMPDMGFLPPTPLTAQKALKLLRHINTMLSIRLNLHESLPRHLRNWKVHSGRATFSSPSEFELDVTTHSEDTSVPWIFADLRFRFSPAPEFPVEGRFQFMISHKLNNILSTHGLSDCFEFLHNFVLTHKILVLGTQARRLLAGDWAESIKIEPVRRSLVVQYWLDRPGKKNWIEIAIASGKSRTRKVSWKGPEFSRLVVRWFRDGTEVKDAPLNFDWEDLSLERMLRKVISLHIGHIFTTTRAQATSHATARRGLNYAMKLSKDEPSECSLTVSLGSSNSSTTLRIDPITGRFALRPCNAFSVAVENGINSLKEPLKDINLRLSAFLSSSMQEIVSRHAHQLGWKLAKHTMRFEAVKEALKIEVIRFSLFHPQGWPSRWALAPVIDVSGQSWWVVELSPGGTAILWAEKLTIRSDATTRSGMASIGRVAGAWVSLKTATRVLNNRGIPYKVDRTVAPRLSQGLASSQTIMLGWVLSIQAAPLLEKFERNQDNWTRSALEVTYHGLESHKGRVRHIVKGKLVQTADLELHKLMPTSPTKEFYFAEDGQFSFLLETAFGEAIVDPLAARVRELHRLHSFYAVLRKRHMVVTSSSLEQVTFKYSASCKATVEFSNDGSIDLKLEPGNPHNRIRTLLTAMLNQNKTTLLEPTSVDTYLDKLTGILLLTLPTLRGFDNIERESSGDVTNPAIHPRTVGTYRMTYGNPVCSFDIRFRGKDDIMFWLVEDNWLVNATATKKTDPESLPVAERSPDFKRAEKLNEEMKELFRTKDPKWLGVRSGLVSTLAGIEEALVKLHEVVRSCAGEPAANPTLAVGSTRPNVAGHGEGKAPRAGEKTRPPNQRDVIQID